VYPWTAHFLRVPPIISCTGNATDLKFCQSIQTVHPNESPLKILEKRERGRIQVLPNFFRELPIISGTGKATKFKFCMHIYGFNWNNIPLKISGKVAVGVVTIQLGHPKIFRAPIHRAHRAVIFAIAQLSCVANPVGIKTLRINAKIQLTYKPGTHNSNKRRTGRLPSSPCTHYLSVPFPSIPPSHF